MRFIIPILMILPSICFGERLQFDDARLSFLGRYRDTNQHREFEWPLSSYEFMIAGRGLIKVRMDGGGGRFRISVGERSHVLQTEAGVKDYELGRVNSDELIKFKVQKISEARFFMLPRVFNILPAQLLYFEIDDGLILEKTKSKSRKIEILGDSNSVGFAALGSPEAPITGLLSMLSQEDASLAYPQLLAEHFDAELRLIATSGKGLVKNAVDYRSQSSTPMPKHWLYSDYDLKHQWNFAQWQADLFVIFLGGNDYKSYPYAKPEYFAQKYRHLIEKARKYYPSSKILTVCGLRHIHHQMVCPQLNKAFERYQAALQDPGLEFLNLDASRFGPGDWGAIHHLNAQGQKKLAGFIRKKIAKMMGW